MVFLTSSCSKKAAKIKISDFDADKIITSELYIDLDYPKSMIPLSAKETDLIKEFFKREITVSKALKGAPFISFSFRKQDGGKDEISLLLIDKNLAILEYNKKFIGVLEAKDIKELFHLLGKSGEQLIEKLKSCTKFRQAPYSELSSFIF